MRDKTAKDSFRAEDYLEESSDFQSFELQEKLSGENNQNFVFTSEGRKYVLRKSKKISQNEQTLQNERKILEFLESEGVDSVPRSVKFDGDNRVHIITYVGQDSVGVEDLTVERLRDWTRGLAEIHCLSFHRFEKFCRRQGYNCEKPERSVEALGRIAEEIEGLGTKSGEVELVEFADEKVGELRDDKMEDPDMAFLTHSDIAGSTRTGNRDFYFIDWEFAGFNFRPFTDLAILFAHRQLNQKQISSIKETYREEVEVPENFEKELNWAKKVRHIFNISWCLNRANETQGEERNRYLNYAHKQKERYSENI